MNVMREAFWLALLLVTGWLIWLLAPVLTPFLIAAVLAYLADPLCDRLEERGLSRTWATVLVFGGLTLLALLLLLFLVPLLQKQLHVLVTRVPLWLQTAEAHLLPWLQRQFGFDVSEFDRGELARLLGQNWSTASGLLATLVASLTRSGMLIGNWLMNLTIVAVVTFYLLRDWDRLVAAIRDLLPRHLEPVVSRLARESDEVLGAFLRGQLLVMLALSGVYSVGLWLAGLELFLSIGLLAGLVSFVPYLGFIVGIGAAGLAAGLQFQDVQHLIYVLVVFGVGQVLESTVFTPLLVGDRIGLHPVAVIFAVLAGGQLFGFVGVLLALPVAAVIAVLLRHLRQRYQASELYGEMAGEGDDGGG